jgi:hypothetical protein
MSTSHTARSERPMTDNERVAAGIKVGISNYVASASLAVLAGALALYTYLSQNFEPPWSFQALMITAALALVASIALGGDGADATVAKVASDAWHNDSTWQFNWQAILTLLALLLLIAATAVGATAPRATDEPPRELSRIAAELRRLADHVEDTRDARARIDELERRLKALEQRESRN